MSKDTFTPQFLFKDETEIKKIERQVEKSVMHLNDYIGQIETTLTLTLSNDEKIAVQENGLRIIYENLKSKFPFPNATQEFNLLALGIDLKPLEKTHNKLSHLWRGYTYKLNKDGIFEIDKATIKNAIDRHTHYTTNERQNMALKMAKELELMFSNVEVAGHLKQHNRIVITDVTGLLEYSFNEKKELKIQPDYYYIKRIV